MSLHWDIFCKNTLEDEYSPLCFGTGGDITYLDWMMSAWGWTLSVSLLGLMIAMSIGIFMGSLRTLTPESIPNRLLTRVANIWVELFRNIPVLVQVFLWYHVIPALVPALKSLPSFVLVSLALGFFTSSRIAEQVRAGIQSLPRGQHYASMALGLTTWQSYRYVILPMALRVVIPTLISESMNIIKNSSVAFAVSVAELTLFAMQSQEETARGIEIYLGVTLLYVISALLVNRLMAIVENKTRVPGFIAASGSGSH